jgi:hypothetical protein
VALGLGIADAALLVVFLTELASGEFPALVLDWPLYAAGATLMLGCAWGVGKILPGGGWPPLFRGYLLYAAMLLLLISPWRRPRAFLALQAAVVGFLTLGFNPTVVAGYDYLLSNPLASEIQKIQAQAPARWLVLDAEGPGGGLLGNYLRILGVPSIDGYQCPPQKGIWHALDPEGRFDRIENQCAFVVFGPRRGAFTAVSPSNGVINATVDPEAPGLAQLGVRYFLVVGDSEAGRLGRHFELLYEGFGKRIYRRL